MAPYSVFVSLVLPSATLRGVQSSVPSLALTLGSEWELTDVTSERALALAMVLSLWVGQLGAPSEPRRGRSE